MVEKKFSFDNKNKGVSLFGSHDKNIKLLEKTYDVKVFTRNGEIQIKGENKNVIFAAKALEAMINVVDTAQELDEQKIRYIFDLVSKGKEAQFSLVGSDIVTITATGKQVRGKTLGQKKYIELMRENTVVFSIGPAGTGKTYLAVGMAVDAFRKNQVNRIILTRPAVEAGENLGFLPGDLQTKVDPYLRPLYDGLFDMMGAENFQKHFERGNIEVAPLAYMRGRTLDNSFIILDEAQNTTAEQMKMFLTRLGANSKAVITGDITQIDLIDSKKSGLVEVIKILKDVEDIGVIHLSNRDVVRHVLVQRIIEAYDKYYEKGGL